MTLAEARGRNQLTPPRRLRPSQLSPYKVRDTKKAGNNNDKDSSMVLQQRQQQSDESVVTASVTDSSWIDTHTGPSTPHTSTSLSGSVSASGVPATAGLLGGEDGHGGGGWDAGGDLDGNRDGVEGPDTDGLGDLLDLDLPGSLDLS
jgi:hypothetical protein